MWNDELTALPLSLDADGVHRTINLILNVVINLSYYCDIGPLVLSAIAGAFY